MIGSLPPRSSAGLRSSYAPRRWPSPLPLLAAMGYGVALWLLCDVAWRVF